MPSEGHMTIAAVVGRNVRLTRELRGWDRDQLADEVALFDIEWNSSAIAEIEEGYRDIPVSELVVLAVVLGVAPQLLFYPKPSTSIFVGPGRDDRDASIDGLEDALLDSETHLPSGKFASWLWEPDGHVYTIADISEATRWSESGGTHDG